MNSSQLSGNNYTSQSLIKPQQKDDLMTKKVTMNISRNFDADLFKKNQNSHEVSMNNEAIDSMGRNFEQDTSQTPKVNTDNNLANHLDQKDLTVNIIEPESVSSSLEIGESILVYDSNSPCATNTLDINLVYQRNTCPNIVEESKDEGGNPFKMRPRFAKEKVQKFQYKSFGHEKKTK